MKTRPSAYPVPEQGGVACLRSNLFSLFLWSLDEYSAFTRDLKKRELGNALDACTKSLSRLHSLRFTSITVL